MMDLILIFIFACLIIYFIKRMLFEARPSNDLSDSVSKNISQQNIIHPISSVALELQRRLNVRRTSVITISVNKVKHSCISPHLL